MISLRNVSKRFEGRTIIDKFSMDVGSGEVVGLWGPNGCGKSTLLSILAGVEVADVGEIVKERDLNIGFAPQNPRDGLLPWLAVRKNFEIIARLKPGDSTEILRGLVRAGYSTSPGPESFPHELSGGYLQRLAIFGAGSPINSLVLLDEPFSNQDPKWRSVIVEWMRERCASGQSFVVAAHEPELMTVVSDRVFVFDASGNSNYEEVDIGLSERTLPAALHDPEVVAIANQLLSKSYAF